MINRYIRNLPVEAVSYINRDMIKLIKSIPDDKIEYSQEEIEWMKRALQNLEYILTEHRRLGLDAVGICERIGQIHEQLNAASEQ